MNNPRNRSASLLEYHLLQYQSSAYQTMAADLQRQRHEQRSTLLHFASPHRHLIRGAVAQLADSLGQLVYRIDTAALIGKYSGETEKNLDDLFARTKNQQAILFFDEADALFGKRTEIKDSHDRYANLSLDVLLQRLESFNGLAVLATSHHPTLAPTAHGRKHIRVHIPPF